MVSNAAKRSSMIKDIPFFYVEFSLYVFTDAYYCCLCGMLWFICGLIQFRYIISMDQQLLSNYIYGTHNDITKHKQPEVTVSNVN